MKSFLKQLVIIVFSSTLVACASTGEPAEDSPVASQARGSDCISQSTVRDYRVLDDANLIVTSGVSRHYHVLLSRPAYGLRSSWQIGFRSASGRICGGFDDLIVDGGFGPEHEEELLVRFGKMKPTVNQAPATQDPAGAEVEELD